MTDPEKKVNDGNTSRIIVSKTKIEIPEEQKDLLAHVSCYVLEAMELSTDVHDQKHFLTNSLQVYVMEAVEAILKDRDFERIVWEGGIGLFLEEFQGTREGRYDPLAFLNLTFAEEISICRNELSKWNGFRRT